MDSDTTCYKYAAFEQVEFNMANQERLSQYLSFSLSLAYIQSDGKGDEQTDVSGNVIGVSPVDFHFLIENLYMHTKDSLGAPISGLMSFFYGYSQTQPIEGFKRQNLDATYLSQVQGNCTVHNLKKALAGGMTFTKRCINSSTCLVASEFTVMLPLASTNIAP